MISLWITKILLWLSHLYWWACRRGQESSTYFAKLSLLWQSEKHWQSNSSCWVFVWRSLERQRLKELTANTHPQMTPPPCPTSSIPRNLLRPSQGGVLQRANFHNTLCFRLFLLFWDANFQSLWHRWPVQLWGGAPQLRGGVWQGQFSRQTLLLPFFVFLVFWTANFHVFLGGWFFFFFKKNTSISWRFPNFAKKNAVPTSRIFRITGKRRADVGQTSGRRRARRATSGRRRADVGHVGHGTSGKRRARRASWRWRKLKKKSPPWNRGRKNWKKKEPVLWCQKFCEN